LVKIRQNFSRILEVFNRILYKVLVISYLLTASLKALVSLTNVSNILDFPLLFAINDYR